MPTKVAEKYTIKLDEKLHDWFKHEAINQRRTLSELVSDAMEAYRNSAAANQTAKPSSSGTADVKGRTSGSRLNVVAEKAETGPKTSEFKPRQAVGPYVRAFYEPGTFQLNESKRAELVREAAERIKGILRKAGKEGVAPKTLHATLDAAGFAPGLRRDALSYLRHNKIIRKKEDGLGACRSFGGIAPPSIRLTRMMHG